MMKLAILFISIAFAAGCANTNCRTLAEQKGEPLPPVKKELDPMAKTSAADRVFVHKADGSLQCNQGKPISPADMKKDLAEIPVYSSSKRNDGQMRIQVCGAPTGNSNVYEIDRSNLEAAIKLGFEEWTFN
ncbi:MAG: hypothetical protein KF789_12420 [Bdellovibrionaceae bacterium]|nr:hypothetical protein [Pseudobdellovibrionaceae bacterium]